MTINFVAIRFDYAGYELESACAVGLVKILDGKQVDSLYLPFNYQIEAGRSNVVRFDEAWSRIAEFINDLPVVANAATTYMRTLEILWQASEIEAKKMPFLCTQVIGRKLTDFGSFSLFYYADKFGYELPDLPTAIDKAQATSAIMLGLIAIAEVDSLNDLISRAGVHWGALSSTERHSCKALRNHGDTFSKSDLAELREGFASAGFDVSHPLFEKYVLITGTLRIGTRLEVEKLLAKVGAYPEKSFTKKTNFLVIGEDKLDGMLPGGKPTSKITKSFAAKSLGQIVEVVDEETFLELLGE